MSDRGWITNQVGNEQVSQSVSFFYQRSNIHLQDTSNQSENDKNYDYKAKPFRFFEYLAESRNKKKTFDKQEEARNGGQALDILYSIQE